MEDKIKDILTRGTVEIIQKESLGKKLNSGRKLKIKFGADPTAPDLHLGHSICLKKLKEFQDLGHEVVFIIGDFTSKIGDPSARNKTRPQLNDVEIKKNTQTYFKQVGEILDVKKIKIYKNSQWFRKMKPTDILNLASKFTVAQILEREDFSKRIKNGSEINILEILYPLMQAYDSVIIKADVEIGGSDQIFNMLAGRELQKKMCQEPQEVMTMPLLIGLDGKEKMSKSLGNYIGIAESAQEQFGKIMSLPDELIIDYMTLLTDISENEIKEIKQKMQAGEMNPKDAKAKLGFEIVSFYHGKKQAEKARKEFDSVFKEGNLPSEMPEIKVSEKIIDIINFLAENNLVASKSEARRLVEQGGIEIDKIKIKNWAEPIKLKNGSVMQIGKKKFIRIKI